MPVPQDDSGGGKIPDGIEVGAGMETVGKLEAEIVGVTVVTVPLEDSDDCGGNNVGSPRVGCVKVGRIPEGPLPVSSTDVVGTDELEKPEEAVSEETVSDELISVDTVSETISEEIVSEEGVSKTEDVELLPTEMEDEGRGGSGVDFSGGDSTQSGKPGKVGITFVKPSSLDVSEALVALSVVVVGAVPTPEE